ncbi:heavy-metal-associated domain-containing protein [Flavihumibacter stibioxidans]|uniref:HMA domain-containing protein n=1 Tax=Flavihumibacter stibioxidans TaxID=1834163 RepID=A0ABR7MBM3_9BACT|nr:heavy-metal-associated domain-containing protein [Flavihumibacter stibioxidans]MBC6492239.1 hypothetical protein [Flavihumibacter stibioxidans]
MKSLSLLSTLAFILLSTFSFGQNSGTNKETIKVWGNCGMCKKTIETAAKSAGASTASWNEESKQLALTYKGRKTSSDKIQQAIAAAGYDTEKFTADNSAYDNLHGCCKYDRKEAAAVTEKAACCQKGDCKDTCCKDGTCKAGTECKKEDGCCKDKSCCKS